MSTSNTKPSWKTPQATRKTPGVFGLNFKHKLDPANSDAIWNLATFEESGFEKIARNQIHDFIRYGKADHEVRRKHAHELEWIMEIREPLRELLKKYPDDIPGHMYHIMHSETDFKHGHGKVDENATRQARYDLWMGLRAEHWNPQDPYGSIARMHQKLPERHQTANRT